MPKLNLSVVIPAHNEEEGVRPTVERLYGALMEAGIPFEILIVNDHSSDHTEQVLQALAREMPGVRYVNNQKPGGFGFAIQTGLERFRGDAVCIVMADASDDPRDVVTYYRKLAEGYECVFGSRFVSGSRVVDYPQHKLFINRMANAFINVLFRLHFNDTTNAFKAYRREVIEGVKPFLSSHFNITVELPLKAITRGYAYTTVPINWYNRATGVSKLRIKEMGSRYLFIVLYVWLEQLLSRGDYRRRNTPPTQPPSDTSRLGSPIWSTYDARDGAPLSELNNGANSGSDGTAPTQPRIEQMARVTSIASRPTSSGPLMSSKAALELNSLHSSLRPLTGSDARIESLPGFVEPPEQIRNSTGRQASSLTLLAPSASKHMRELPDWAVMLIVALVAWALIVSRRPDAIFNAQFWAEDSIWFSQAYNQGALQALLIPHVGYLSLVPRLTAALSLLFPILYAPLVFNVVAILLRESPAVFLFSRRFDALIPSQWVRAILAFLYLALPNSFEVNATITNAQWHISVLACMIVIAAFPKRVGGRVFDGVVIALSGLSGPFCVALAPILVLRWVMDRRGHTLTLFVVNALAIAMQAAAYLSSASSIHRVKEPLGASPLMLARLLAGQVFLGATLGMNQYARIYARTWWSSSALVVAVAATGLLLITVALWKGPNELRLFVLYAGAVYGLCLISPLSLGTGTSAWQEMTAPGTSARYEYIPMVAFVAVLVWLLSRRLPAPVRAIGGLALMVMLLVGVPSDWQYPPFTNLHYGAYVAQFASLPAGSDFTIPINPNWDMTLHKR